MKYVILHNRIRCNHCGDVIESEYRHDFKYRVQFCPPGIYTIVTTSSGAWASLWGKLKSGIGWLSLDFCQRV